MQPSPTPRPLRDASTEHGAPSASANGVTDPVQGQFDLVAPSAGVLMESLRATGYSLPDAVSDLIDNSIAAGAKRIWLNFYWAGRESWASILDDGAGMSEAELVSAMRIGSRSPREEREPSDLGRFGLGLKTASISQARSVTVATRAKGKLKTHARRWDLDHLAVTDEWQLLNVPVADIEGGSVDHFLRLKQGTLVVWNKLDRMVGEVEANDALAKRQFHNALRQMEQHIAMVFHRLMTGSRRVSIELNGQVVTPWDPFLGDETATQKLPSETLGPSDSGIRVTPFVLPHQSRLSDEQHRAAAGPAGWNAQQGFYIYRNRRLLLAGDWLGLGFIKEEHYKLARIQLDLSNSDDHSWEIDVRKSKARPPLRYRDDLRRIAQVTRKRAVDVYRHRGKTIARTNTKNQALVWQRRVRRNKVFYEINREHPLVKETLDSQPKDTGSIRRVLRLVEEYVPVQQIWVDLAEGDETKSQPFESAAAKEITEIIRALYLLFLGSGLNHNQALERLGSTEAIGERFELIESAVSALLEEKVIE